MIEPDMLERWDCETAEYAYFQCAECRKDTKPESEWADACGEAMDAGWRKIEGEVYCKDCIPLIIQRTAVWNRIRRQLKADFDAPNYRRIFEGQQKQS